HHQVALGITTDDRRGPTARSERPFDIHVVQFGGGVQVLDDPDDPAALRDVAHQLRGPGVDLVVALVLEPLPILLGVGRQTGRCHGSSWSGWVGASMPDRPAQPPGAVAGLACLGDPTAAAALGGTSGAAEASGADSAGSAGGASPGAASV